eukprot:148489-Pelagomonas_calceolata.AAC.1
MQRLYVFGSKHACAAPLKYHSEFDTDTAQARTNTPPATDPDFQRKSWPGFFKSLKQRMMGRAGRPQYDRHGCAVIMVHEPKKQFYKRFLYEPFPVESSLANQ